MQDNKDHDLLIEMNTKLQMLIDSFNKMTDGTKHQFEKQDAKIDQLEKRIESLEAQLIAINLAALSAQTAANVEWIKNFRMTWKVVLSIAGTIGSAVSFVVMLVLKILKVI